MSESPVDRLWSLVEHARHSTVHYAAVLPAADPSADPGSFLARVPLLDRATIRRAGVRLRSAEGDTRGWRLARTTGTTGEPIEVVIDADARAAEAGVLAAHVDRWLGRTEWRRGQLLHLALQASAVSRAMPSPWHSGALVAKWNLIRAWQASDSTFLEVLAHISGHIVSGLPSMAEVLAERVLRAGVAARITPRLFVLSGEPLSAAVRRRIASAFAAPVSMVYTLTELGTIATECVEGSYHVEEEAAWVEVVDESGRAVAAGVEGEIVATSLVNRAMPLVRYRTGDRGRWRRLPCRCGRFSPMIELTSTRRVSRFITADGATVNVVRFAKLLASLDVERFTTEQLGPRRVRVAYQAARPLPSSSVAVVTAAIRSVLGPEVEVALDRSTGGMVAAPGLAAADTPAEPLGPDLDVVAEWLNTQLAPVPELEAAFLVGSSLDPEWTSRDSDIDLLLLVRGERGAAPWRRLAADLRTRVPRLNVTVDRAAGLERRAPLFACRLNAESRIVAGRLDRDLSWPSLVELTYQARFWAQESAITLGLVLGQDDLLAVDPVREAWRACRYALGALRFMALLRGERRTAARTLVSALHRDQDMSPHAVRAFLEAADVARERRPPPLPEAASVKPYHAAALAFIEDLITRVPVVSADR